MLFSIEELSVAHWHATAKSALAALWRSSGISPWLFPVSDGAEWWVDPQVYNLILLAMIAVLLVLRFGHEAKAAPRRVLRAVRGMRDRRRLIRRSSVPHQTGGRLRFRRRPIADFESARAILEQRLASMVGLAGIKEHLLGLLDTLEMDQRRCSSMPGFVSRRGCMHMTFVGNPGTGKTAVAQLIATVLKDMGVLRGGHLVVARKDDLLGRYSNHVSRNTRRIIESALGGVLFIDEAYSLLQGEVDLGREILNILCDLSYAYKNELVVVLAGYTHAMADLFSANAGLASRFPHKFRFDDYSAAELLEIGRLMLDASGFALADEAAGEALARMVTPVVSEVPCGNARSVENRLGAAIFAQSRRLRDEQRAADAQAADAKAADTKAVTDPVPPADSKQLFELTAADLDQARAVCDKAGAVFDETPEPGPSRERAG